MTWHPMDSETNPPPKDGREVLVRGFDNYTSMMVLRWSQVCFSDGHFDMRSEDYDFSLFEWHPIPE